MGVGRWETAFWAVFHGVHALFVRASFECGRTDLAERRMSASLVIEHFDVIEQLPSWLRRSCRSDRRAPSSRSRRSSPSPRCRSNCRGGSCAGDAGRVENALVVFARVGAALVGVVQQPELRTPPLERHVERFQRQVSIVDRADGPADDEARKQIEDRREIQLAAARRSRTRSCRRPTADSARPP